MEEYLTIKDAAALLGVTPRTIKRWMRAGIVKPTVRIKGIVRFKKDKILLQYEQHQWGVKQGEDPILG